MGTTLLTYTTLLFVAIATPATRSRVEALTLSEYTALIEVFEETRSAKTAERLVEFSPEAIRKASDDYTWSILASHQDRDDRKLAHRLKLPALLHTEASLLLRSEESAFLHMDIAKGFIQRIENDRERRALIKTWCLAMGYYFQFHVMESLASLPLETALQLDTNDVRVLLALGQVSGTSGWMRKSSEQLGRAEMRYREIMEIEPSNETAQIGLAHVLVLKDRHNEAFELVEPLAGKTAESHLDLVSLLILGDIYKSQDQLAKAIRSYRKAVHFDPSCQAAVVALSHALYRDGEVDEARNVMGEFLANSTTRETDSWWIYLKGDRRRSVDFLEKMRKELGR
jgi:tetratricopeptide (TPR) repeat protein